MQPPCTSKNLRNNDDVTMQSVGSTAIVADVGSITTLTTGTLTVTGNEHVNGNLTVDGSETVTTLTVTGDGTVNGNLTVHGSETVDGTLTIHGTIATVPSGKMMYLSSNQSLSGDTIILWNGTQSGGFTGISLDYASGVFTNNTGRTLIVNFTWQINWNGIVVPPTYGVFGHYETYATKWGTSGVTVMDTTFRYGFRREGGTISNLAQSCSANIIMMNTDKVAILALTNATGLVAGGPENNIDTSRIQYAIIN